MCWCARNYRAWFTPSNHQRGLQGSLSVMGWRIINAYSLQWQKESQTNPWWYWSPVSFLLFCERLWLTQYLVSQLLHHLLAFAVFLRDKALSSGWEMIRKRSWRWLKVHKFWITDRSHSYLSALSACFARSSSRWCYTHIPCASRILLYNTVWHHYWRQFGWTKRHGIMLSYVPQGFCANMWYKRIFITQTTCYHILSWSYSIFCCP